MICPNCNKEVEDSSVFCSMCGAKINGSSDYSPPATNAGFGTAAQYCNYGCPPQKTGSLSILFKIAKAILFFGVIGFLTIVIVGLIAYGRVYFYDGYTITKVLCTLDIVLMLSAGLLTAIGLIIRRRDPSVTKTNKAVSIIAIILAVAFSIILIISAANNGKNRSNYSSSSYSYSSSSYEMSHSTYCTLYMKVSNVNINHRGNYTYCTGTVTNTGTYQIKFVKVKGVFKDYSGNIIDTDWTYAVDSSWLDPGESKTFEMMIRDENERIKTANVSVVAD